jgi:hypothetical protein
MFVDRLLPIALQKLVTIIDSAQLIEAAKLLREAANIVASAPPAGCWRSDHEDRCRVRSAVARVKRRTPRHQS